MYQSRLHDYKELCAYISVITCHAYHFSLFLVKFKVIKLSSVGMIMYHFSCMQSLDWTPSRIKSSAL